MDEMDVESVDLGDEMRQRVQLRLAFAPIVICRPIVREFLHRRELHALRCVRDRFPLGPSCRRDASAEIDELLFRNVDVKRADSAVFDRTHL